MFTYLKNSSHQRCKRFQRCVHYRGESNPTRSKFSIPKHCEFRSLVMTVLLKMLSFGSALDLSLLPRAQKFLTNMDSKYNYSTNSKSLIISLFKSLDPLRRYDSKDIILQLPGDLTIFEIDWLAVFDPQTNENCGWVIIPDGLNVPPSLIQIVVSLFIF